MRSGIVIAGSFALREFLLLHNHLCGIYLLAIPVRVTSSLDSATDYNANPLMKVLLRELCPSAEDNAGNKICGGLPVAAKSTVDSQSIPGNRQRILSC